MNDGEAPTSQPFRMKMISKNLNKATIYLQGPFGYSTLEVNDLVVFTGPYAQYQQAVFLEYRPKGARKGTRHRKALTGHPKAAVVEGWGRPQYDRFNTEVISGCVVRAAKHAVYSPEWEQDFSRFMEVHNLSPVVDLHGWNAYSGGYNKASTL